MPLERLVLISAYRMPTHHALMLGEDDTTAWLLAWRALWHPALLARAVELPTPAEPSQHSTPQANTLYALPVTPDPYLPENWNEQLRAVGSAAFRTAATWDETDANLRAALAQMEVDASIIDQGSDPRPFYALGFGYAVVDTLFDAMYHEKTLDLPAFTAEVKAAATGAGTVQAPADRLMSARDTLYPVTIHLIELAFLSTAPLADLLARKHPVSLIATADELANLQPAERAALAARMAEGKIELCGGIACDRPEAQLPLESQLWNLRRGQARLRELMGQPATVFARATSAFHPYVPNWLMQSGMSKLIYVPFDGAAVPHHAAAAIRWPAPDGRRADAFTRTPLAATDAQTYFHLAHHLHQSIANDSAAVLALRFSDRSPGPWYDDWRALDELAPILGTWTTIGRYLEDAQIGEYAQATTIDDYPPEDLEAAVNGERVDPISRYARHARLRRRMDAACIFAALAGSLNEAPIATAQLEAVEDELERNHGSEPASLAAIEKASAEQLATRLLRRAKGYEAGWLF